MPVYVRPFVKSISHAPGCLKRNCGPACVRVTDGFEYHLKLTLPSGEPFVERKKSSLRVRSDVRRFAETRAAHILRFGLPKEEVAKKEIPTLDEFWPRYIEESCEANRLKPSTIIQKKNAYRHYLRPRFGDRRLDQITNADVAKLKAALADLNPKTVNNVLVALNTPLKTAVKWGVIAHMPCVIELLRTSQKSVSFYEQSEYERLVVAAGQIDSRIELVVLLGGDAGLRCGEIIALEQTDLDLKRGILHVRKSEWEGHLTLPKGGRERQVNLTERLKAALTRNRHLRGDRVLWRDDGLKQKKVTQVLLAKWMRRAQKRAGLKVTGGIHILRHTFCSRLAMLGAPAKAIQELAGHQNLSTTQRYMHLSPAAKSQAIELLNREVLGDIKETAQGSVRNP